MIRFPCRELLPTLVAAFCPYIITSQLALAAFPMEISWFGEKTRSNIWTALVGGMAGFAAGLLFAPEEGQRTRRRLIYQLEHLAVRAALFAEGLTQQEVESAARQSSDALVADAHLRAEQIRDDIDALLEEMRKQQEPSD